MRILLFSIAVLLGCASLGNADSDSSGNFVGRGHRVGKRMRVGDDGGASPGTIHGHCMLLEGNGNPISGPCVNVVLVLNDLKGSEVLRTRTSTTGDFAFAGAKDAQYLIITDSKSYEIVAPLKAIHGGERVDMKLRYK